MNRERSHASLPTKKMLEAVLEFGEREYYVRPAGQRGSYEVAVFQGTTAPTDVYTVRGLHCSCPAGGGSKDHKHIELVRLFQRLGEPACFMFWRGEDIWHARRWTGDEHVVDSLSHRASFGYLRHHNGRR